MGPPAGAREAERRRGRRRLGGTPPTNDRSPSCVTSAPRGSAMPPLSSDEKQQRRDVLGRCASAEVRIREPSGNRRRALSRHSPPSRAWASARVARSAQARPSSARCLQSRREYRACPKQQKGSISRFRRGRPEPHRRAGRARTGAILRYLGHLDGGSPDRRGVQHRSLGMRQLRRTLFGHDRPRRCGPVTRVVPKRAAAHRLARLISWRLPRLRAKAIARSRVFRTGPHGTRHPSCSETLWQDRSP
jgi:hypothetical protein